MPRRRATNVALVPGPLPRPTPESGREPSHAPARVVELALPALAAVELVSFDVEARSAVLRVGGAEVEARVEAVVDDAVLATAAARGERVIAQREDGVWVVLGVLRTSATPGVDRGDDFVIAARRVVVQADHEIALVAGETSIALRAVGRLELLAKSITSRAEGVQKLVARMLHLN